MLATNHRKKRCTAQCMAVGLAAILAMVAGSAQAGYQDSFQRAIKAIDFEDWAQASAHLRSALRDPRQAAVGSKVRIYGTRFKRYLPNYYLGLARYRAGDCEEALEAFQRSLSDGAVGGLLRGRLMLYLDVCRQRQLVQSARVSSSVSPSSPSAVPPQTGRSGTPRWPTRPTRRQPSGGGGARTPSSTSGGGSGSGSASPPVVVGGQTGGATRRPTRPRPSTPQPTPSGSPQSGSSQSGSGPSRPVPQSISGVRAKAMAKKVGATQAQLKRGDRLARDLAVARGAGSRPFSQDPQAGQLLDAAVRLLGKARFHLSGGEAERDLDAVDRALGEATAAVDELELLRRRVGR